MLGDNFSREQKYKLYRSVEEIIHPTISKKNISNYKIVIEENLVPLIVFYPKKISNLTSAIIFIPGDGFVSGCRGEYSNICKEISDECDKLVIALDYFEMDNKFPSTLDICYKTVMCLLDELEKNGIFRENVVLMGDSTGANLISSMALKNINFGGSKICREILLYPVLSGEYFGNSKYESISKNSEVDLLTIKKLETFIEKYVSSKRKMKDPLVFPLLNKDFSNYPKTLVVTGNLDPLKDEGFEYYQRLDAAGCECYYNNIKFAAHGFLSSNDLEIKTELYRVIKDFIK